MRRLFVLALMGLWCSPVSAQTAATVVASCGTPPATYTAGATRAVTQSTAGNLCTSASASGTFTDDATGTTGSPVPGSAAYTGLNVAGNLVGQTGTNPSGSVYTAQVDLAAVGGATVKTGTGTSTGALRVAQSSYSFSNITSATTTTVKSGAGTFHALVINTPIASATITIYDNTAASGTKIATITLPSTITGIDPVTVFYDAAFATGLTIVTSGATDLTVSYL